MVLESVTVGRMVAPLGKERSATRFPEAVLASTGVMIVIITVLVLVPEISVAERLIFLRDELESVCAVFVTVLLKEKEPPPANAGLAFNDIADLPASRFPEPVLLRAASSFLQEVINIVHPSAINIGNDRNFFMMFWF